MSPVLLVVAGPNGAGKTTVTTRLRKDRWSEGVEYLNPDDIARDRFGDCAHEGIAFETVLSTPEKIDFLIRAKQAGYFLRVFFIGTSDPRINAARVAGRVMEGGHSVPIDKLVARYARSMANLSAAISVADRAYVYDNSVENDEASLCIRTQDGLLRKVYGALPTWVAEAVEGVERHPQFVDMRAA